MSCSASLSLPIFLSSEYLRASEMPYERARCGEQVREGCGAGRGGAAASEAPGASTVGAAADAWRAADGNLAENFSVA